MKKFFYLLFSALIFAFSTISLVGCSSNEVEKASKNLTKYSVTMALDDEKKILSGKEKVSFVNATGKTLDYVCFHLYPRAFRKDAMIKPYTSLTYASCFPNGESFGDIEIKKVFVANKEASFKLVGEDEDILKIDFGFNLDAKKIVEIIIEFLIQIPNSTHRFGFYDGNVNLGNWYPVVCEFIDGEFDMTPYYSIGDPFCSSVANYYVEFLFPQKYSLCSTGTFDIENVGDQKKAKITAKAVRDFAMCLSENAGVVTSKINNTKVTYMGKADDEDLNKFLELSKKAIEYFSKIFGEYPYSSLSVVKTPFVYGGMEYPNIVFVSNSIDDETEFLKVIVHEIAHQWWYGVVGNNETQEAWLDESLSEYSTALFFKHNTGFGVQYNDIVRDALSSYLLYVDVIETIRGDVNTKMNLKISEYKNDYEYSYMVYVKGVIMFDSLSNVVGENKVIAGLKKYYKKNKFKIATKKDFYSAFKSACHKDLEGFFEGYLNGSTIITNIN